MSELSLMDWIAIGTALVTCASAVAAITPTPKDDQIIGKLYKIIDLFALNVGQAKRNPPNKPKT